MSETGTTNPKGNTMKIRHDLRDDSKDMVFFDVAESTSVESLSVMRWADVGSIDVIIKFKSNVNTSYIYKFSDATHLMFELLLEDSAGRVAQWIKAKSEETWKVPNDGIGVVRI